tara:strand:+ start:1466 stop:1879 length:414 start_codon:yes stop_codon:yes gene_type:complete
MIRNNSYDFRLSTAFFVLPGKTNHEDTVDKSLSYDREEPLPTSEQAGQKTNITADSEIEGAKTELDHTKVEAAATIEAGEETQIAAEGKDSDITDDLIEDKVIAFEKDLSLICPTCRRAESKSCTATFKRPSASEGT